jgi:hypothetical protein
MDLRWLYGGEVPRRGAYLNTIGYWKNGELVELSGSGRSRASSICVSGNDVYVGGEDGDNTGRVATLWKNGERIFLSGKGMSHELHGVFLVKK